MLCCAVHRHAIPRLNFILHLTFDASEVMLVSQRFAFFYARRADGTRSVTLRFLIFLCLLFFHVSFSLPGGSVEEERSGALFGAPHA